MNEKMKNGVLFLTVCVMSAIFAWFSVERIESLEVQEDLRNQNSSIALKMK